MKVKDENNQVPESKAESRPKKNLFNFKLGNKAISIAIIFVILIIVLLVYYIGIVLPHASAIKQAQVSFYQKLSNGDITGAEQAAKEGLAIDSNNQYFLNGIINAIAIQGNSTGKEQDAFKKASPYIMRLQKNGLKNADYAITIGYVYEIAGKYDQALSYYNKALNIDPNSAYGNFHKGHVLYFLNRSDEAKPFIEKAYSLNPNDGYIQLAMGNLLLGEENTKEAMNLFLSSGTNLGATSSQRAEAYTAAAFLAAQTGQQTESLNYSKKAYDLDPTYALGVGLYGFNDVLNGLPLQGLQLLDKSIKLNPRITYNDMYMGVGFRTIGFYKEAISSQKFGIDNIKNDNTIVGNVNQKIALSKMQYELAQTYSAASDTQNALNYLKLALVGNTNLKNVLKNDLKSGYFSNVKNNQIFLELLNQ